MIFIEWVFIDLFREGNDNPFQYSCLGNPMDRGAWQAIDHGVAKSWIWLTMHAQGNLEHTQESKYTWMKVEKGQSRGKDSKAQGDSWMLCRCPPTTASYAGVAKPSTPWGVAAPQEWPVTCSWLVRAGLAFPTKWVAAHGRPWFCWVFSGQGW